VDVCKKLLVEACGGGKNRVLVGNPKGKRLLGIPRHRYRGNGSGFAIYFWAE
jgi:hypothetical protein